MSNNKDTDTNEWVQWIEDGIKKKYINYYEYDDFQNIQRIDSGGFGNVYRAYWKTSNAIFALKSFRNDSDIMKEIVNELQLLLEVQFHANVIKFFGITKRKNNIGSDYLLILEYADGGTLRNYLKDNFNELNFNMKLQLAIQIADAVSCLHQKDIIHRDLHPNNILVHQNTIKLADFGRSCRLTELSNSPKDIFGMLPYIDPQLYKDHSTDKKSDVYSVGVILWEISSGRQPFESCDEAYQQSALLLEILNGKRETPIPGIPTDYINIYTKCWQDNPDDRPDMEQVLSELKQIRLNINEMKPLLISENANIKNNVDNEKKALQEVTEENYKNTKIDDRKDEKPSLDLARYTLVDININETNTLKKIVPFPKFHPLISEIGNLFNEVIEITQAAEHNTRICNALKQRVYAAHLAVLDFRFQRDNQELFNEKNYLYLQNLVTIIAQIKKFMTDVSQMKTLLNFIHAKSIEKTFKELCRDFDSCIVSIGLDIFTSPIKNRIRSDEEVAQLREDQEDLARYIEDRVEEDKEVKGEFKEVKVGYQEMYSGFSSMVLKVNAMNNTMGKLLDEQTKNTKNESYTQTKIDKIFKIHQLNFSDYKKTDKEIRVTKWVNAEKNGEEFAFKSIEDKTSIQNQVTILKELHNCQNIIKFYGLVCDGYKWYLVTEWAEYGNLHEFYTTHKDRFDLRLKLRISLDIACGLNVLRTVEIVHHDIRAKNILITFNYTAKLANFKSSHSLTAATSKQSHNLERVRYCAPELLERAPNFKYDHKCEVYSFGILLWEISEEKTPYQNYKDIGKLSDLVCNKMYREKFSENSPMPQKFQKLAIQAVNHDPESRPKIAIMFNVLNDCFESFGRPTSLPSPQPKPISMQTFEDDDKKSQVIQNEISELDENEPSLESEQQIIRQFKLNHGLFLDGSSIKPSKQAVFFEDGVLNMSLYKGQPLVYTFINDCSSHSNLLRFDYGDKNVNDTEFIEVLRPSDICINFPVFEITYNAGLLESFSNDKTYEMYGHLFARKILIGDKLFIDDFQSATSIQIDSYKSLISWIYNSAKYKKENPFSYLSAFNFFPKIRTSDGKKLNTPEKLINWMNNLYQKNMVGIISYNNLIPIPISKLRFSKSSLDTFQIFNEKLPGVANFKEKLSLEEWVRDSIYVNLTRWVKEFHLLQGLIINKSLN